MENDIINAYGTSEIHFLICDIILYIFITTRDRYHIVISFKSYVKFNSVNENRLNILYVFYDCNYRFDF